MNVSIGERWETFVDATLREGRYASASEVVREGLRLVEEREARLRDLRATLATSIANGGEVGDDRLDEAFAERRAPSWGRRRRSAGSIEQRRSRWRTDFARPARASPSVEKA